MLLTVLIVFIYGSILLWGSKAIRMGGSKLELVLFLLLFGWCAYIQFSVLFDWRIITPVTLQTELIEAVSRWMQ